MKGLWLVAVLALVGCGDQRVNDILALTADVDNGAEIYGDSCSICHGVDGGGDIGSNLHAVVPDLTDDQLVDVLLNGIPGTTMPGFADSLDDQGIADVLLYLKENFGAE